jgi:hypothetical protein
VSWSIWQHHSGTPPRTAYRLRILYDGHSLSAILR